MSNWLYRITTKWLVLAATIVFAGFVVFVLPAHSGTAGSDRATADGAASAVLFAPDLSLWYSPAALSELAEQLGAGGRAAYVREHFTFDLVWPVVYLLFLTLAITSLSSVTMKPESRWRSVNLIPFAAVMFDLLENTTTSLAVTRYPAAPGIPGTVAPVFTALKWTAIAVAVLVLAVETVALALQAVKTVRKS